MTRQWCSWSFIYLALFSKLFFREVYIISLTLSWGNRLWWRSLFRPLANLSIEAKSPLTEFSCFPPRSHFLHIVISFVGKAQWKFKSQVPERWQNICIGIESTFLKRCFPLCIAGKIRHKEDSDSPGFSHLELGFDSCLFNKMVSTASLLQKDGPFCFSSFCATSSQVRV